MARPDNVLINFLGGTAQPGDVAFRQHAEAAAPGVTDDRNHGFPRFSQWLDTSTTPDSLYVCTDDTPGAAVWRQLEDSADTAGLSIVTLAAGYTLLKYTDAGGRVTFLNDLSIIPAAIGGASVNNYDAPDAGTAALTFAKSSDIWMPAEGVDFEVTGFAYAAGDRTWKRLWNRTGKTMSIPNNSGSSSAANRVLTPTGATVQIPHLGGCYLQRNDEDTEWVMA